MRQNEAERRRADRFPMNCHLRYRTAGSKDGWDGIGRSVNMSGTGLLFTTRSELPVGTPIEVSILWPAKRDDAQFLKLEATVQIVRSEQGRAATEIEKCQFLNASSSGLLLCK